MEGNSELRQKHVCLICFESLASVQNLKQHMNIHTGHKPYKCSYPGCFSEFKHASQLSCHKSIHLEHKINLNEGFYDLKTFLHMIVKIFEKNDDRKIINQSHVSDKKALKLPSISIERPFIKLPLHNLLDY